MDIPIHECEETSKNTIYFLPPVHPMVYPAPGQRGPTFQQAMDAVTEAYVQAAKRGEIGVIRNLQPE